MEELIKEILYDYKDGYADSAKSISSLFKAFIEWIRKNCYAEEDYWVRIISDGEFEALSTDETFQYWLDNIYNK